MQTFLLTPTTYDIIKGFIRGKDIYYFKNMGSEEMYCLVIESPEAFNSAFNVLLDMIGIGELIPDDKEEY